MSRNKQLVVRSALALIMVLAISGLLAGTASAHAKLISSTPRDGQTLTAAPSKITASFGEETSVEQSYMQVYLGSTRVDNGDGKVDTNARTVMNVTLKAGLGDGVYTVKWHTVTEDDNGIADGSFSFTVASGSSGSPNMKEHNIMPPTGAGNRWVGWLALLAALALVGGLTARRLARR